MASWWHDGISVAAYTIVVNCTATEATMVTTIEATAPAPAPPTAMHPIRAWAPVLVRPSIATTIGSICPIVIISVEALRCTVATISSMNAILIDCHATMSSAATAERRPAGSTDSALQVARKLKVTAL